MAFMARVSSVDTPTIGFPVASASPLTVLTPILKPGKRTGADRTGQQIQHPRGESGHDKQPIEGRKQDLCMVSSQAK